jgi:hypothetical protein
VDPAGYSGSGPAETYSRSQGNHNSEATFGKIIGVGKSDINCSRVCRARAQWAALPLTRRGGDQRSDQRGRLGMDSVKEHGDGSRCLMQGPVSVVSVHDGQGRGVLMSSEEPSVEAVPSHRQGEFRVMPLRVRGDHAGGSTILSRRSLRGIVLVHASGLFCAAVVRVVSNVGQEHHPLPGGW